jgi:hypothetical protein
MIKHKKDFLSNKMPVITVTMKEAQTATAL